MSTIRRLPPPAASVPVPDVVALLERSLARATAGEIRGVGVVAVLADGMTSSGFELAEVNQHIAISALAIAQARLVNRAIELSVDVPEPPAPPGDDTDGKKEPG